jgi:hypothetical protein
MTVSRFAALIVSAFVLISLCAVTVDGRGASMSTLDWQPCGDDVPQALECAKLSVRRSASTST